MRAPEGEEAPAPTLYHVKAMVSGELYQKILCKFRVRTCVPRPFSKEDLASEFLSEFSSPRLTLLRHSYIKLWLLAHIDIFVTDV